MAFRSLFTKGIALTSAGRTGKHSRKASSLARQAMNSFRQARSLKGDKKIDKMLDGLNYLSNSVLEVSDSITPISTMNATSALLADNIQKMINQSQLNIINTSDGSITKIKNSPNVYYIDQGGLLDVYVEKRDSDIYVFLCFSKASEELFHSTVVLEKSILVDDKLENKEIVFTTKKPHKEALHFGCRIAVSDNYVYLSLGERGNRNNSQNINNYEGSIVRVKFENNMIKKNPFNNDWLRDV